MNTMSDAAAISGGFAPVADAIGPFARALAAIDITIATEVDMSDVDAGLIVLERGLDGAAREIDEACDELVRDFRGTKISDVSPIDGLIDSYVESRVAALRAMASIAEPIERIRKATRRPFPRTYRVLSRRLDRAEQALDGFKKRTDDVGWQLRALRSDLRGDAPASPIFETGDEVRKYLDALE